MSRNKLGGKIGVLIILIVLFVGAAFIFSRQEEPIIASVEDIEEEQISTLGAEVTYAEGAVEYMSDGGQWTRVTEGTTLSEGDSIETLGEGRAIIQLDDGSVLRLNANSAITLVSMDPNNIVISNDGGEVYSRVVKLDRTFQVASDGTTYESLGTAYLTINKEKEKGVEVFHSKVKVTDDGEETVVDEGKMFFIDHHDEALEKAIADIPEEVINDGEFVAWNKDEDTKTFSEELGVFTKVEEEEEEVEEETKVVDTPAAPTPTGIVLTYISKGNISWKDYVGSDQGFKVVWSKSSKPTYPTRSGDKYKYFSNPETRSATINAFDGGGTYYIRVCEYLGGKCGVYSNQVQATFLDTIKDEETKKDTSKSSVTSISISANGSSVSWSTVGHSAQGFKVVWSKNASPTYPTRSGDKYKYLSSPDASSQSLSAFDGEGTYYVRVCEYLGGKCGVYSNQVQVQL